MECSRCKFQFCWRCLNEFYTSYHYYQSFCPLRAIIIYAVVTILVVLADIKLAYTVPLFAEF